MTAKFNYYFRRLDSGVDVVRQKSKHFCEAMELSAFAYVRVYHDGRVGWVTSDADHDRLLFDSGFIAKDPLIDTAKALKKGCYLWFHDREFPGSENFYKLRTKNFNIDHGMVMVNHQKEYLETTCFSGLLKRRPLYNLFTKEKGLFKAFTEHFKQVLNPRLKSLLEVYHPCHHPPNYLQSAGLRLFLLAGWQICYGYRQERGNVYLYFIKL
jgi:hypothetical protein